MVDQRVPNNEVDADETAEKAIKGDDNSKKGNKDNSDKWCGLQQKIQLLRDEPVVAGMVLMSVNEVADILSWSYNIAFCGFILICDFYENTKLTELLDWLT